MRPPPTGEYGGPSTGSVPKYKERLQFIEDYGKADGKHRQTDGPAVGQIDARPEKWSVSQSNLQARQIGRKAVDRKSGYTILGLL